MPLPEYEYTYVRTPCIISIKKGKSFVAEIEVSNCTYNYLWVGLDGPVTGAWLTALRAISPLLGEGYEDGDLLDKVEEILKSHDIPRRPL